MSAMEHIEYLKEVSVKPVEFLRGEIRNLDENKQKVRDNPGAKYAYVSELREERITMFGTSRRVRRVFVATHDTGGYLDIGWIVCDDMDHCMLCLRKFGLFFDPQIHCHACGNVVCGKCCHATLVNELKKLGEVPVCEYCDWGQATISITPSPPDSRKIAVVPTRTPKYANINLWNYGRVQMVTYTPVFVLRTRRVNKTRAYINVSMCAEVPINPKGLIYAHHHRWPLGRHGAVDRVQHALTWEKQRAVEAEKRAKRAQERAKKVELQKQAEKQRLLDIAEAERIANESNSDDEDGWQDDSEIEDDISEQISSASEEDEDQYSESEYSEETASEASTVLPPAPPPLPYDDLSQMPPPAPLVIVRPPRRAYSDVSESDLDSVSESSEGSEYSSAYSGHSVSGKSTTSHRSLKQRIAKATRAFMAMNANNLRRKHKYAANPDALLVQIQDNGGGDATALDVTFSDLHNPSTAVGAGSKTHTGAAKAKATAPLQHGSSHPPPQEVVSLEFETILPLPRRTGYQRTANYYDFGSDKTSVVTSEDSESEEGSEGASEISENARGDYISSSDDTSLRSEGQSGYGHFASARVDSGDAYSDASASTQTVGASIGGHHAHVPESARDTYGDFGASAVAHGPTSGPLRNPLVAKKSVRDYHRYAEYECDSSGEDSDLESEPASVSPTAPAPSAVPTTTAVAAGIAVTTDSAQQHAQPAPAGFTAVQRPPLSASSDSHPDNQRAAAVNGSSAAVPQPAPASTQTNRPAPIHTTSAPHQIGAAHTLTNDTPTLPTRAGGVPPAVPTADDALETGSNNSDWSDTDDPMFRNSPQRTPVAGVPGPSAAHPVQSSSHTAEDHQHSASGAAAAGVAHTSSTEHPPQQPEHARSSDTVDQRATGAVGRATPRNSLDHSSAAALAGTTTAAAPGAQAPVPETATIVSDWTSTQDSLFRDRQPSAGAEDRGWPDPDSHSEVSDERSQYSAVLRAVMAQSLEESRAPAVQRSSIHSQASMSSLASSVAPSIVKPHEIIENYDPEVERAKQEEEAALWRLQEIQRSLTANLRNDLIAHGIDPDPPAPVPESFDTLSQAGSVLTWGNEEEEEVETETGTVVSEYEDELPVDTYMVCGEKGTSLDHRDVFDVCVNPEVIYACNADQSGELLLKLTQQVLLAVTHVNNDLLFQSFEYVQIPENYARRFMVKTAEQLERDAAELKAKEERERLAAEEASNPLNSVLSFFGYGPSSSASADDANISESTPGGAEKDPFGSDDDEEMHELDPLKRSFKDEVDNRAPQVGVPVLAAFKHLTAVASNRAVAHEMPVDYGDSQAVYASYDQARPVLQKSNHDFVYQSMVHKIKAAGGPSRLPFKAAAFSLQEYNAHKGKPLYKSDAQSDKDFEDSDSVATGSEAGHHDGGDGADQNSGKQGAINAVTLQKLMPKDQRSVTVIAKPAFVIKSRRLREGKEKVFINVLHHPTFDELVLSGIITVDPHEEPLTGLGDSFVTRDKDGAKAAVYNVLIASSYVKIYASFRKYEKRVTDPQFIKMIIETINDGCQESLSTEDYSLPRIKHAYKGENPQYMMNFVFQTLKSATPRIYKRNRPVSTPATQGGKSALVRTKLASVPELDENADETDSAGEVTSGEDKAHRRASAGSSGSSGGHSAAHDDAARNSLVSLAMDAAHHADRAEAESASSDAGSQLSELSAGGNRFSINFRRAFSSAPADDSPRPVRPVSNRAPAQKFRLFGGGGDSTGSQLVTVDMIEYYKELSIDKALVDRLKHSSVKSPQVLLGWQLVVVMEAGQAAGLYVVTAVSTGNFVKKTEFRLSHPQKPDQWVRLRRSSKASQKSLYFFPTRKVLFLEHKKQVL